MIPLPQKIKIEKIKENLQRIIIEPLYPAYGYTIGNPLRRVLLSSIPGAAITEVKIKDVSHEFSTIPGVLEDVIVITQNLKKMRFRLQGEEPQKIFLKTKGKKEVKGKDFILPSQLELINPEIHILTITDEKMTIEMEASVERGIGYLSREERERKEREIGTILIDAVFSPIQRVALEVENMRVEKRTDYERVILEIETDNTISPIDAFLEACAILKGHFELFPEKIREK